MDNGFLFETIYSQLDYLLFSLEKLPHTEHHLGPVMISVNDLHTESEDAFSKTIWLLVITALLVCEGCINGLEQILDSHEDELIMGIF